MSRRGRPDMPSEKSCCVVSSTQLAPGGQVTVEYADFVDPAGMGLGLYETNSFGSSSAIRDYMQYLTEDGFRESVAVTALIWPEDDMVTGDAPYTYVGDGLQNGAAFWQGSVAAAVPSLSAGAVSLLALLGAAGGLLLMRGRP